MNKLEEHFKDRTFEDCADEILLMISLMSIHSLLEEIDYASYIIKFVPETIKDTVCFVVLSKLLKKWESP